MGSPLTGEIANTERDFLSLAEPSAWSLCLSPSQMPLWCFHRSPNMRSGFDRLARLSVLQPLSHRAQQNASLSRENNAAFQTAICSFQGLGPTHYHRTFSSTPSGLAELDGQVPSGTLVKYRQFQKVIRATHGLWDDADKILDLCYTGIDNDLRYYRARVNICGRQYNAADVPAQRIAAYRLLIARYRLRKREHQGPFRRNCEFLKKLGLVLRSAPCHSLRHMAWSTHSLQVVMRAAVEDAFEPFHLLPVAQGPQLPFNGSRGWHNPFRLVIEQHELLRNHFSEVVTSPCGPLLTRVRGRLKRFLTRWDTTKIEKPDIRRNYGTIGLWRVQGDARQSVFNTTIHPFQIYCHSVPAVFDSLENLITFGFRNTPLLGTQRLIDTLLCLRSLVSDTAAITEFYYEGLLPIIMRRCEIMSPSEIDLQYPKTLSYWATFWKDTRRAQKRMQVFEQMREENIKQRFGKQWFGSRRPTKHRKSLVKKGSTATRLHRIDYDSTGVVKKGKEEETKRSGFRSWKPFFAFDNTT